MNDLTHYSDDELSLLVMNDESLYEMRHSSNLVSILDEIFTYTPKQLEVLQEDLADD